jgi:hypothetical protein
MTDYEKSVELVENLRKTLTPALIRTLREIVDRAQNESTGDGSFNARSWPLLKSVVIQLEGFDVAAGLLLAPRLPRKKL